MTKLHGRDKLTFMYTHCSKCGILKHLDLFTNDKSKPSGKRPSCKKCDAKYAKRSDVVARRRGPRYVLIKRKHKLKMYGITSEEYDALLVKQNDLCAICEQPETRFDSKTGITWPLSIDHNHITGKGRGLLCHSCNVGLGFFKENIQILERAVKYVKNFSF